MSTIEETRTAKSAFQRHLVAPGIPTWLRGIGIGKDSDGFFIKVNVNEALPNGTVPNSFNDVRIVTDIVGDLRALSYSVGDFMLPRTQFPDDHYRIVSLDDSEADLQAINFGRPKGKRVLVPIDQLHERFTQVLCKGCKKAPATVYKGSTLTKKQRAENKAWSDSFKNGMHTGHCPHLELPQPPTCQSCK